MSNDTSKLPPIRLACSHCNRQLELEGKLYDKPKRLIECPYCEKTFDFNVPSKYVQNSTSSMILGLAVLGLLGWGIWWVVSSIFSGGSSSGSSPGSSSADLCNCINSASYYNARESACDKRINAYLGHDWKTSMDPNDTDRMKNACR